MDKKQWIADKIEKLITEGKDPKQAAAIAYSMWEDKYEKKDADSKAVDTSAFVYLDFADDPDLIELQARIKALLPEDAGIDWQIPKTFHITLAYCENASDENIRQAFVAVSTPPIHIFSARLGIFENPNERALHVVVESGDDLTALQAAVFDGFARLGLPMSPYSAPAAFTPHITLAYLPPEVDATALLNLSFVVGGVSDTVCYGRDEYKPYITVKLHAPVSEPAPEYVVTGSDAEDRDGGMGGYMEDKSFAVDATSELGKFFETNSEPVLVTHSVTDDESTTRSVIALNAKDAVSNDTIPDGAAVVLFTDEHKAMSDDPCIQKHMDEMMADGMDQADAMKKAEAMCAEEKPHKSLAAQVKDALGSLLSRNKDVGFKVYGNYWFARWSNNFQDRDGEWFTEKAHDDYVDRVNAGVVPMPELWVEHIPGTRIGEAKMVGRIEHFMIAAGTFDDTILGRMAKTFYRNHAVKGVSHGFGFDKREYNNRVFHQYNTFEISPLRKKIPSNPWTTFNEDDAMAITEKDIALLNEMFGEEVVKAEILGKTLEASKVLGESQRFKDYVVINDGDEGNASKEAVENVERDFKQLLMDVVGDHAEVYQIAAGVVKAFERQEAQAAETASAQETRIKTLEESVKALAERLGDRPRSASKDAETAISKTDERFQTMEEAIRQQTTVKHPFFGTEVNQLDVEGQNGR